MAKSFAM